MPGDPTPGSHRPGLDSGDMPTFVGRAAAEIGVELTEAIAPGLQLLRPIGAGAMGLVFLARDPLLKRFVAIKVLSPEYADSDVARARFVREAEASAAVAHPNVAAIYVVGELPQSSTPYFVMQFIEGRTLADEIAAGAVSEPRAKRMIGEIASALGAAHARGLVHRDVKPSNIMIEAETDRPVVLDFGISAVLQPNRLPEARLTSAGSYLGTPTYMSPEQASGEEVTGKSDVYSLGVMAFELVTGRALFHGPAVVIMAAHVQQSPPAVHDVRPGVDQHLADLIERCLRKEPERRPAAADIAEALLPGRRELVEWPPPGLETMRGRGWTLTWRWAIACALVLAFFMVLHVRPSLASPRWNEAETSLFWSGVSSSARAIEAEPAPWRLAPRPAPDFTLVWMFIAGASIVGAVLLVLVDIALTLRLARDAELALRGGYPWRVIFDVAWDAHDDTPALLNGAGRFALIPPDERRGIARMRRTQGLVAVATVLVTGLAPLLWLAGWLRASLSDAAEIITGVELAAMAAPLVLGTTALAFLERRAHAGRGARWSMRARGPVIRREAVQSWLGGMGRGVTAGQPRRLVGVLAPVAGIVIALIVGYATLVVFFVVFASTSLLIQGRSAAKDWRTSFERAESHAVRFAELDELARASGVPPRGAAPDFEDARLILARPYLRGRDVVPAASAIAMDIEGARAVDRSGPEPIRDITRAIMDAVGDTIPPTVAGVRSVQAYAESPWLAVWRRFAYSPDYPIMWEFRPGLPGARYATDVPVPTWNGPKDLAYRNFVSGYVSMANGDTAAAIVRARENIAASRPYLRTVTPNESLVGLVILGMGRQQLFVIGKATRNQVLIDEAQRLRAMGIRRKREEPPALARYALAAEPSGRDAAHLAMDTSWPADVGDALFRMTYGYCLNPREILFGPDPARGQSLDGIVTRSRIPRLTDLARLGKNWLNDATTGTATLPAEARRSTPLLPPPWIGLKGFRDRVAMCQFATEM